MELTIKVVWKRKPSFSGRIVVLNGDGTDCFAFADLAAKEERERVVETIGDQCELMPEQRVAIASLLRTELEKRVNGSTGGASRTDIDTSRCPYSMDGSGISYEKETREGPVTVQATNFAATILADIEEDDGAEICRIFDIEAGLSGCTQAIRVPAERFAGMTWVTEQLGSRAIVFPGQREHARTAIQMLSDPEMRHVYAHTGWRLIDGVWCFLHAGGAIGPVGPVSGVDTAPPPALSPAVLPEPPGGALLRDAVKASLGLVAIGGQSPLGVSLLAATYRAALGAADLSVFLVGPTGAFKTEAAALVQQHFGAGFHARQLPASWSSTANALEDLTFRAKDLVLVIDDFVCQPHERSGLHAKAERVLRAVGNRSGRGRMRADLKLRPDRPPRCLALVTGEDIPRGHSLRARSLIVPVEPGSIHAGMLTRVQTLAGEGAFACAMSGFVRWVAGRYDPQCIQDEEASLREEVNAAHRRTATIGAQLGIGLRYVLRCAVECGALGQYAADACWDRFWPLLLEAVEAQAYFHAAAEPANSFIRLIGEALASGRAHLVGAHSEGVPHDPRRWGWAVGEESRPRGTQIGWVDKEGLYLLPRVAYAIAERLGSDSCTSLSVGLETLKRRLDEAGLLIIERTGGERRLTVRKVLGNRRRRVLQLPVDALEDASTDED